MKTFSQVSNTQLLDHSDPHTKKIMYAGTHVGNMKSELREVHTPVARPGKPVVKLEPVFKVTPPEDFNGSYTEGSFTDLNKAIRHAYTQHMIGSAKWTN